MNNIQKILKAIRKINSDAIMVIEGEDIDTCTITWLEDTTPISKDDIKAMISTVETEMANAEQAAIDKKASGKQKLLDLGLDEDEVKALIGE
jgi:hypothetical protein